MKHIDFSVVILLTAVTTGVANLYLYCVFGKMTTESFEKISDAMYECNWQEFPVDFQKYLLFMITNAQRRLFYDGFGLVVLNLYTFCKV